ncbi:MAG: hypothetical protein ACOY32_07030 [Thermodesulfobacteriota bacterium]
MKEAREISQRIAFSCIIAVIAGLLIPKALTNGLDRALLVWLVYAILAGVVLEATLVQGIVKHIRISVPSAATVTATIVSFYIVRVLASSIIGTPVIFASGVGLTPDNLISFLPYLLVFLAILFAASLFVTTLSSISGGLLIETCGRIWQLGPESLDKTRKLLLSFAGVVAALIVLWGSFA